VHHRLRLLAFPMRTRSAHGRWSDAGSPSFRRDLFTRDVAFDPGGRAVPRLTALPMLRLLRTRSESLRSLLGQPMLPPCHRPPPSHLPTGTIWSATRSFSPAASTALTAGGWAAAPGCGLRGSIEGGPAEQIDRSVDRRHLVAPDASDCLRLRENCARVPSAPSRRLR
jgi:hypothetical protein